MRAAAVVGLLAVIGLCAGCATQRGVIPPITQSELGTSFAEKAQQLYGGEIMVQAFTNGVLVTHKDGRQAAVLLKEKNPHLPPYGLIGHLYRDQGGAASFGEPIQGEHRIFGNYTFHIFQKAVIFSGPNYVESAVFQSSFGK